MLPQRLLDAEQVALRGVLKLIAQFEHLCKSAVIAIERSMLNHDEGSVKAMVSLQSLQQPRKHYYYELRTCCGEQTSTLLQKPNRTPATKEANLDCG